MFEKYTLQVFKNEMLSEIFEPIEDGLEEEWKELHNEELCCI
jgi:hypothetical protein